MEYNGETRYVNEDFLADTKPAPEVKPEPEPKPAPKPPVEPSNTLPPGIIRPGNPGNTGVGGGD